MLLLTICTLASFIVGMVFRDQHLRDGADLADARRWVGKVVVAAVVLVAFAGCFLMLIIESGPDAEAWDLAVLFGELTKERKINLLGDNNPAELADAEVLANDALWSSAASLKVALQSSREPQALIAVTFATFGGVLSGLMGPVARWMWYHAEDAVSES